MKKTTIDKEKLFVIRRAVKKLMTDMANAERIAETNRGQLLYCEPQKVWYFWDCKRWVRDEILEATRRAKAVVESLMHEAESIPDPQRRATILKHATQCQSVSRITAMLRLASAEEGFQVLPSQFDNDPWLLNLDNGVLDLRATKLLPHNPDFLMTKIANVEFDPHAECPLWESFLERITNENQDLIDFFQRVVGYLLTGDVSEQALFILHGYGANGKTVFLETVKALLGDYSVILPHDLLVDKKFTQHPAGLAELAGKRAALASEIEIGSKFSEALVKLLTGGDTVKARRLYENFWEFVPSHKILLAANTKPYVHGQDHGFWRRIKLIPFEVTIPAEQQDKRLTEKLRRELPGILAWAVRGCILWKKGGLREPQSVVFATQKYRSEMDTLGQFITETCDINPHSEVLFSDLFSEYGTWCEANNSTQMSRKAFAMALEERGYASRHTRVGNVRSGLVIKSATSFNEADDEIDF